MCNLCAEAQKFRPITDIIPPSSRIIRQQAKYATHFKDVHFFFSGAPWEIMINLYQMPSDVQLHCPPVTSKILSPFQVWANFSIQKLSLQAKVYFNGRTKNENPLQAQVSPVNWSNANNVVF